MGRGSVQKNEFMEFIEDSLLFLVICFCISWICGVGMVVNILQLKYFYTYE